MDSSHFEKVIDDLVSLCGAESKKADLARRIDTLFDEEHIKPQDINNWRKRGIPHAKVSKIAREFNYPEHEIRPDSFLPPDAAVA